jgi:hypothetical protein
MEIIKDDIEDNLRKNAKRYLNNTVIYRISQKRWILSKRRRSCRGLHHPA